MRHVPPERFRIVIFEDEIEKNSEQTLAETYEYLGLDPRFTPDLPNNRIHKSWGWTRIVFNHYASSFSKTIGRSRAARLLDRFDVLIRPGH